MEEEDDDGDDDDNDDYDDDSSKEHNNNATNAVTALRQLSSFPRARILHDIWSYSSDFHVLLLQFL